MQENDDYSLINVVKHIKEAIQKTYGDNYLVLQYKWAKPTQPIEGNLKYKKILENSHKNTQIMNANRQMKKKPYVHLKSSTQSTQFNQLLKNVTTLQKTHPIHITQQHKIDLNFDGQKISFDSDTMKWTFKTSYAFFRPNYEAVKNGNLFRISMLSQFKGNKQPKKKVIETIREALNWAIEKKKEQSLPQDKKIEKKLQSLHLGGVTNKRRDEQTKPFRFKQQTQYELNPCITIVTSKVYQVVSMKMYDQIYELVNNQKNSHSQTIGKILLSDLVKDVFEEYKKELTYQVELRFSSKFIQEFEDMHLQEIEEILQKAGSIFINLFKDVHQFSPEQIIQDLKSL